MSEREKEDSVIPPSETWKLAPFLEKLRQGHITGSGQIDAGEIKDVTNLVSGVQLQHIERQFILQAQDQAYHQPFLKIWNVPYRRNPFFTGREDLLIQLHERLSATKTAALTQVQAISGLGGIGKTQTAVEYVYRYGAKYRAVFWVKADSRETIISDFVAIAELLDLPEKSIQDHTLIVKAVKRWLQSNDQWLLVLDNADDLLTVEEFIPAARDGSVLLTTRDQAIGGLAQRVEIDQMGLEEGILFLLRRAGIITVDAQATMTTEANRAKAQEIVSIMDGLPLALDQAGAYLEETKCSLSDYLELYKSHRKRLLRQRGRFPAGHPAPVATTWSLSFERIKANPAAIELMQLFAFLHPDAIPEEVITDSANVLGAVLQTTAGNQFALNAAIEVLLKFSLVRRDANTKTLTLHRLVQVILRDEMNEELQTLWVKRTIRAVEKVFPRADFTTWQLCQKYLPQAERCYELIKERNIGFGEAAQLLSRTASYLRQRGRYVQAEPLYREALTINKRIRGSKHSLVTKNLNDLGELYYDQGKYKQAEQFYQQALDRYNQTSKLETRDGVRTLNNLTQLYYEQRSYVRAEELCQQSLEICQQWTERKEPNLATSLSLLASLYRIQNKHYEKAEPFYQEALEIYKQSLGENHPSVASTLTDLADLYFGKNKLAKAGPLYQRALTIREHILGMDHPEVATSLYKLAVFYHSTGRHILAEPLYQQALESQERLLGPEHPNVADTLSNLASLYLSQRKRGKYVQAEALLQRALQIREQRLGPEHLKVSESLLEYAYVLQKTKRGEEALKLINRAERIRGKHRQQNPTFEEEKAISLRRLRRNNYLFAITVGCIVFLLDWLVRHFVAASLSSPNSGHSILLVGNYLAFYYAKNMDFFIYSLPIWVYPLWLCLFCIGIPLSRRVSRNHSNLVISRMIGARIHRTAGFVGFAGAIADIIDQKNSMSSISLYIPNAFHIFFNIADIAWWASPLILYSVFLLALIEKILRWRNDRFLIRKFKMKVR